MIYEKIRELAKEKGYSIRKVESICNFSNGTVRGWAIKNNPPARKLKQVADLLGVTVDELLR